MIVNSCACIEGWEVQNFKKYNGWGKFAVENLHGIWIGENATVAIIDEYRVSFLRTKKDLIISVLQHCIHGVVGVVYGFGVNNNAYSFISTINPTSRVAFTNSIEAKDYIQKHSHDKVDYDVSTKKIVYTMYNCTQFDLTLAEKITMSDFERVNEIDGTLSIAERMALWQVGKCFEYSDGYFNVRIDTQKYSILFSLSYGDDWVYCRVGQNGFCEKGRAMLSTICIRQNETRMIENNLLSANDYKPVEDCFIVDGCSFPPDGGWYWSVKQVTDNVIYLNGCGGQTYEIHRK